MNFRKKLLSIVILIFFWKSVCLVKFFKQFCSVLILYLGMFCIFSAGQVFTKLFIWCCKMFGSPSQIEPLHLRKTCSFSLILLTLTCDRKEEIETLQLFVVLWMKGFLYPDGFGLKSSWKPFWPNWFFGFLCYYCCYYVISLTMLLNIAEKFPPYQPLW